jgi:NADH-quinone oxidoreductase subunit L
MNWILAIPLMPAAVFFLFFLLPRRVRNNMLWLPIGVMGTAMLLSLGALRIAWPGGEGAFENAKWQYVYHLGVADARPLDLIMRLDPYAAMMLAVVTIVAFCVEVYSLSYMKGEDRIGWYYAVLSLFTSAMLFLVLAGDYLLFYMSWEIMGLCSYLLIGFWNRDAAARAASIKAFLVTRVGDVGFAIGLVVMWTNAHSFDFAVVLPTVPLWGRAGVATLVALLLLFGAMGKSAQVPLHVWLPDAMAGPTPASALIHAATMVAAGVFLVARSLPIFVYSGVALQVVLFVGGLTAFMAATMGAVQYDIKKVLAYSTISQLGYMFMGLGTGAVGPALFHLLTHAFFKSLLFLGAGSVIHSLHTQDMREMGGVWKKMQATTVLFTVGSLALAGIIPFSGFFSKDTILDHLWMEGHRLGFIVALVTAGLTAFYVTRLWLRVFPGESRSDKHTHAHESDWKMLGPMTALAVLAIVSGWFVVAFGRFLGSELELPTLGFGALSTTTAVVGVVAAWTLFGRGRNPEQHEAKASRFYTLVSNKYYFDVVSDKWIAVGYLRLSEGVNWFDRVVINGIVNFMAVASRAGGSWLRELQNGRVLTYQRLIVGTALGIVLILVVAKGG